MIDLVVAIVTMMALFVSSLLRVLTGHAPPTMQVALICGLAGFATTAAGTMPGLSLRQHPQRLEDSLPGLAAGMMLAVLSR